MADRMEQKANRRNMLSIDWLNGTEERCAESEYFQFQQQNGKIKYYYNSHKLN